MPPKQILLLTLLLAAIVSKSSAAPFRLSLPEPYESVCEPYLLIQQKLTTDTFVGVTASAQAMQAAVKAAGQKTFPPDFAREVDALVAAPDLAAARTAFKSVSTDLVVAFKLARISTGALHEVYCPRALGCWIQTDASVAHNPYLGSLMPNCGDRVADF